MAAPLGPRARDAAPNNVTSNDFRLPCTICCRKFVPEALDRHEKICQKMTQKKRKIFDSAKQRILGTDIPTVQSAPPLIQSCPTGPRRSNKNKPKPRLHIGNNNNNTSSNNNNNNINSREPGRGPPTSFLNRLNSGLVQCPSCERNFSDKAADRHIPWCKELRARIPRSPPCTVAKYRLDARIQYKAPLPGKRRNSPPRSPTKMITPAFVSTESLLRPTSKSDVSPIEPKSVNVTGTAIQARHRRPPAANNADDARLSKDRVALASSDHGSLSNLSGSNNGNSNGGMINSSSWEYFDDESKIGRQLPGIFSRKQELRPKKNDATNYNPYETAQRQMQELLMSSPSPSSPVLAPINKSTATKYRSSSSSSTIPDRPEIHSNNSSAWSLESDKDLEDIEEDIVVFDDDDPIFEEIIAMQATPISLARVSSNQTRRTNGKHPRRAVSREEALYGNKINTTGSLDSDYGSLLRRSPSTPVRLSVDPGALIIGSSCSSRSSSETSLPRLITSDITGVGDSAAAAAKMSRFCHECGAKYPIAGAKFCCECGIRRLCI